MNARVRIAVAGLGWVALHRHIPAIRHNPAFELVGVIDRHPGHAANVANKLGLANFAETDTLTNVPWLSTCDALTIAAPPFDHAALAQQAFAHGLHVLTEKPFALNEAEGQAVVDAARAAKKTLGIVHNFQFSRAAERLQRDIENNRLGPLHRIAAVQLGNPARRLPSWYESLPLGLFYDESPHFFYLLRKLAGPSLRLTHAACVPSTQGLATPALAQLLYLNENKIPVSVSCAFESALSEWHIVVSGEKATGIVDIFRDIYIRLPNDGRHEAFNILRTSLAACGQHLYHYIPNGLRLLTGRLDYGNDELYRRFAEAIVSGKDPQDMGASDALAVLHLQQEAIKALQGSLAS